MRESKDITREELLGMIGTLRGVLIDKDDVLYGLNFDVEDRTPEWLREKLRIYHETAFNLSDSEGDVKTASERIAELEEKLAAANAFIEANKDVISEKAAKMFVSATKTICENVDKLGKQMVNIIKRACDDCPHRQEIPCETCKMVEEVKEPEDLERLVRRGWFGKTMTLEELEEQRRSFAHGNAKLHNPNVTRELIDQEAEKLKNEEQHVEVPRR